MDDVDVNDAKHKEPSDELRGKFTCAQQTQQNL